jgi:serine/threonine protein kinase
MPLAHGTNLGPYQVLSALGAGGMGEVYRARDTRLDRDDALKVLPEAFASDAERMARFEREAKVLASLSHTNIAPIFGLEDSAHMSAGQNTCKRTRWDFSTPVHSASLRRAKSQSSWAYEIQTLAWVRWAVFYSDRSEMTRVDAAPV